MDKSIKPSFQIHSKQTFAKFMSIMFRNLGKWKHNIFVLSIYSPKKQYILFFKLLNMLP